MDEPDRLEKGIRFGCGAALGLAVAVFSLVRFNRESWAWWVFIPLIVVLAFGSTACLLGDEFWYGLFDRDRRL